jgi:hypothetical protein
MMEEIRSSETSVLTRATGRNILEDVNLHSHRRENLKPYITKNILRKDDVPVGIETRAYIYNYEYLTSNIVRIDCEVVTL